MIRLSLYILPLLYAVSGLAVVVLLWLYSLRRRRKLARAEMRDLFQCRLCASWLRKATAAKADDLLRCTCCGALNEPSVRGNDL